MASTFVGVLLADPDSALSRGFTPIQSPLKMPDNTPIDSIAKWMLFSANNAETSWIGEDCTAPVWLR
ncbi:hypothetical protein AB9F45_39445, partial [Rhizobium leguminosarum]|uniref:hypothetical protein n=1 Tax=Rhizobium leguminosarum TaxID=384 RepID=UPI003F9D44EC